LNDHQALVSACIPYLKSQTKGLLARWYSRLSPFLPNHTLEHKGNQAIDALSRSPVSQDQVLHIEVKGNGTRYKHPREMTAVSGATRVTRRSSSSQEGGCIGSQRILYFEDYLVPGRRCLVASAQFRRKLLLENCSAGHFALEKLI